MIKVNFFKKFTIKKSKEMEEKIKNIYFLF